MHFLRFLFKANNGGNRNDKDKLMIVELLIRRAWRLEFDSGLFSDLQESVDINPNWPRAPKLKLNLVKHLVLATDQNQDYAAKRGSQNP